MKRIFTFLQHTSNHINMIIPWMLPCLTYAKYKSSVHPPKEWTFRNYIVNCIGKYNGNPVQLDDVNSSACACGIKIFTSSITDIHQVFDTEFSLNLEVTNYQAGRSVSPHHLSPALRTGNTGMGYYTNVFFICSHLF